MYRYSRTVTIRNGASFMPAIKAAGELTAYLNRAFGLQMRLGAEQFGALRIHFYHDVDRLDEFSESMRRLSRDEAYLGLLEGMKPHVLEGSAEDRLVELIV